VLDLYLIARIDYASGKNGFVKISSYSDFSYRFFELNKVFIDFFGEKKEFLVEDVREVKGGFILKFRNFDNDDDTKILIGKEIYIDKKYLVELPENYFFIHDLIGSKVLRNNVEFGTVRDVISSPANDIYVIEDIQGKEILIPAVKDYIESIDPVNKILILKPGESIYDDED
jgi:16S rRNA processing protein RimM